MSLLISDAWAAGSQSPGPGMGDLVLFVVLIVVFYMILIRPQMKRAKEHKGLVESLQKGDEVVTGGGILGKIKKVGDNYLMLEIADKLEIKVQKQAITGQLQKGTIQKVL